MKTRKISVRLTEAQIEVLEALGDHYETEDYGKADATSPVYSYSDVIRSILVMEGMRVLGNGRFNKIMRGKS